MSSFPFCVSWSKVCNDHDASDGDGSGQLTAESLRWDDHLLLNFYKDPNEVQTGD
jgi:hypothetical protein